jgi:hypothetical protein
LTSRSHTTNLTGRKIYPSGFYSVTLSEEGYVRTASVLAKELGFHFTREEGNGFRYETVSGSSEGLGSIVDVLCIPYTLYGVIGVGTIHRVAWQTPTDEQQKVDEKAEDLGTHLCFRLGSNLCVRIYLYLRKEKSNNVKQKTTTS